VPPGELPGTEDLPAFGPNQKAAIANDRSRLATEPLIGGFDDHDYSEIELGPGDSQYELSSGGEAFPDYDSQAELPAIGSRQADPIPIPATDLRNARSSKPAPIVPWYGRLVEIWTRYQIVVTLGYGALGIVVLGFCLIRTSFGGQSLTPASSSLVVGFLGAIAFVLLSLSGLAQSILLIDLARRLRRLHNDFD